MKIGYSEDEVIVMAARSLVDPDPRGRVWACCVMLSSCGEVVDGFDLVGMQRSVWDFEPDDMQAPARTLENAVRRSGCLKKLHDRFRDITGHELDDCLEEVSFPKES